MSFDRVYYKLNITSESPLSIGSGANVNTDNDVILDGTGKPFIPGTSLTGILRNYIKNVKGAVTANTVFGFIPSTKEENEKAKKKDEEYIERDTIVSVYDGLMTAGKKFITNRDMVALEKKVAKKGAKFDMEAVEPGAVFTSFIELKDSAYCAVIEEALAALNSGFIRFGSKSTRGYGKVSVKANKKSFNDVTEWLGFDMWNYSGWGDVNLAENPNGAMKISLKLKSRGGISIREYTTEPSTEETTMPDYITMGLHTEKSEKGEAVPVIPGTTWAGAFSDRYKELTGKAAADDLFGFVHEKKRDGDDKTQKSLIIFDESRLRSGVYKETTRNSIDRFTGGTKNGALYTEKTYYYGETELNISIKKSLEESELKKLAFCIADLHNGFLAVGGLTSVGRGLFEILEINGTKLSDEEKEPKNICKAVLKGVGINE